MGCAETSSEELDSVLFDFLMSIVGGNLRFSKDTFDSPDLGSRFKQFRFNVSSGPSGAQVPDTGSREHAKSEHWDTHVETHDTFGVLS
jgi:hypothetical protein